MSLTALPPAAVTPKRCVILQPSYLPWRGYFHQIQRADVFVFYDDVQFDRHGWRNRNRVKGPHGAEWLTVPVLSKGSVTEGRPTSEIQICWARHWNRKHWGTLQALYGRSPYFGRYAPFFEEFYRRRPDKLADWCIDLTVALARELGIVHTQFLRSSELAAEIPADAAGTERLMHLLRLVGATEYLSGPSASDYLEEDKLREIGVNLEYMRYDYPEYPQAHPPFDGQVSVVDLLFQMGPHAGDYIWGDAVR